MKIVHFLCCDKRAKVPDAWLDVQSCPYCGKGIAII